MDLAKYPTLRATHQDYLDSTQAKLEVAPAGERWAGVGVMSPSSSGAFGGVEAVESVTKITPLTGLLIVR